MRFTKMHGLGNDFIFVMAPELPAGDPAAAARRLCRRRHGIGADGLVLLYPAPEAAAAMRIFNPDGSEAEICGNALRCAALYLAKRKQACGPEVSVETKAGLKKALLLPGGTVRVDMGSPVLESTAVPVSGSSRRVIAEEIDAGGYKFLYSAVSMGNPHCVIFLEPGREVPVEVCGPLLEKHHFFPQGANVEFCRVKNDGAVEVRVWERGAGATLACGSGACAAVVAGVLNDRLKRQATVYLPGGALQVEWSESGTVFMEGPAAEVFEGEIELEDGESDG